MPQSRLFLVPAPLDFGCAQTVPLTQVLPQASLAVAAGLSYWIAENAKTARAYIQRVQALLPETLPVQQHTIVELPRAVHKKGDHQPGVWDAKPLLNQAAQQANAVGLLSEAGMPAIADPGAAVVRAAHDLGWHVVPLVGPVSLTLALSASGLNGQNFAFVGYLPQQEAARATRLRELQAQVLRSGRSQILIETPYRNQALWQALLRHLDGNTRLAFASGLSLPQQLCASASVASWRERPMPVSNDVPAVFLFGV